MSWFIKSKVVTKKKKKTPQTNLWQVPKINIYNSQDGLLSKSNSTSK